jgi:hypothetical protein
LEPVRPVIIVDEAPVRSTPWTRPLPARGPELSWPIVCNGMRCLEKLLGRVPHHLGTSPKKRSRNATVGKKVARSITEPSVGALQPFRFVFTVQAHQTFMYSLIITTAAVKASHTSGSTCCFRVANVLHAGRAIDAPPRSSAKSAASSRRAEESVYQCQTGVRIVAHRYGHRPIQLDAT